MVPKNIATIKMLTAAKSASVEFELRAANVGR